MITISLYPTVQLLSLLRPSLLIALLSWFLLLSGPGFAQDPDFEDIGIKVEAESGPQKNILSKGTTDLLSPPDPDFQRAVRSSDSSVDESRAEVARSLVRYGSKDQALELITSIKDLGQRSLALAELAIELGKSSQAGGLPLLSRAYDLISNKDDPHKEVILTRIALGYAYHGQWQEHGVRILKELEPSVELSEVLIEVSQSFLKQDQQNEAYQALIFLREVLTKLPEQKRDSLLPKASLAHRIAGKLDLSIELSKQIQDRDFKLESEVLLTSQLLQEGETETAMAQAAKLVEKVEKLTSSRRDELLERLGYVFAATGDGRQTLKTARAIKNEVAAARIFIKASEYYRLVGDAKKAKSSLVKANQYLNKAPTNASKVITRGVLALQAQKIGENYKSTRIFKRSVKEAAKLKNAQERAFALARLGELNAQAGMDREGESLLLSSKKIVSKLENEDSHLAFYFGPVAEGEANLEERFLVYLSHASESIDAAFFEIRSDAIVDAFIQAKKNGIKVRMVVDSMNYYGRSDETGEINKRTRNPFIKKLIEAKVEVVQDDGRSSLMHNKFCVIDQQRVWTGSYNLTDTGALNNENSAMEVVNDRLAHIYSREFKEMFEDSQFGPGSPSHKGDQEVRIDGKKMEVFFAPEDDPLQEIRTHVENAKQGVYFMQFALTDDELGEILIQKHKDGVEVKGIFDYLLYRSTGPYAEFSKLAHNEVPVVVYHSPLNGKLHHKVFIIDPEGENPKVIFGSENSSSSGNNANDENIVVVHDAEVARLYLEKFRELYGKTSSVKAEFMHSDPLEKEVKRIRLKIDSNGKAVEQIRIEFPARWPEPENDLTTFHVLRNLDGKLVNTKDKEVTKQQSQSILIESANMTKTGPDSQLFIDFIDFSLPEIPGFYNLYVEVKYPNFQFLPLKIQPAIEVLGQ